MKTLLIVAGLVLLTCVRAFASSTIYDGVIQKVEHIPETRSKNTGKIKTHEDVELTIRVLCSPYSSETVHSWIMTHRDGDYRPQVRRLRDFKSWFVDEIPVTREQMMKLVKPGMRMTTFENRANWYFFRLEIRNNGSRTGRLESVRDGVVTLSRPQHQYQEDYIKQPPAGGRRAEPDGKTYFTDTHYPPMKSEFELSPKAEVITPDGSVSGSEALAEFIDRPVFYQPARAKQRVELVPTGYGDWKLLVDNDDFLGREKQLKYSSLQIMLSTEFEQRNVKTAPPDSPKADTLSSAKVFDAYLIAGWREPGEITTPIYYKGEWNIVDGYYSNRFNFRHLLLTPGRPIVATSRRGRFTPDALAYSSEMPAAWGTITKIDGTAITVQAPDIEGSPISGKHQIALDSDAEFVQLGQQIDRSEAIQTGALIRVYSPHPARFFVDN